MCNEAVEKDPRSLYDIPDNLKTQEICDKAVEEEPGLLQHVPDWFFSQQQIKLWHDDDYWYDDDKLIEWYEGYQKRKVQKAKVKEELLPIAWHPNHVMNWCMSGDEKGVWR